MGYDVHITRADSWYNAEAAPISLEEFFALVKREPDLHVDPECWYGRRMPDGNVRRIPGVAIGTPKESTQYLWAGETITSKAPEPATIMVMVRLARRLNAKVQWDDEEIYDLSPDGEFLVDGQSYEELLKSAWPPPNNDFEPDLELSNGRVASPARWPVVVVVVLVLMAAALAARVLLT